MRLIQCCETDTGLLQSLHQWCEAEWGHVDPQVADKDGLSFPYPIAMLNGDELVAGLAFTRYASPITQKQAVWINAVLVKPEYRRRGLSSQLITFAEHQVKQLNESELFVFTHIPDLYTHLDWHVVETTEDKFVLKSAKVI